MPPPSTRNAYTVLHIQNLEECNSLDKYCEKSYHFSSHVQLFINQSDMVCGQATKEIHILFNIDTIYANIISWFGEANKKGA